MKVIFVALTTYQMMIAVVYAKYVYRYYCKNITIVALDFDSDMWESEEFTICSIKCKQNTKLYRIWKRLFYSGRLYKFSKLSKLFDFDKKNILFVFNDNEPITNNLIKIVKSKGDFNKVVIVDEGIGIYTETKSIILSLGEKIRLFVTTLLGSPMQYKAIGDNKDIDFAIVGNVDLYNKLPKAFKQKVLSQNKRGIFKLASHTMAKIFGFKDEENNKDSILFLGQPILETNQDRNIEKRYLSDIFKKMSISNKILIKQHPRENRDKYNFLKKEFPNVVVLNSFLGELPIEALISFIKPSAVVAYNSSGVLNIANMNRNIICILTFGLPCSAIVGDLTVTKFYTYREEIFKSKNDNLYIPIDDEEFIKLITSEKQELLWSEETGAEVGFNEIDILFDSV